MNELIKITTNEKGEQCVLARDLHDFLGIKRYITQWIEPYVKDNNEYGFEKDVDFTSINVDVNPTNNVPIIEYVLTLDMAKELAMLSKSEKGKKIRKYFIQCEKKAKELMIENYKLKIEIQEGKMKFLQDKANLSEKILYAHNFINTQKNVNSYMPSIIINIFTACRKSIIRQEDKAYYFNAEDVKKEFAKYEIKPTRFKEILECMGGYKDSIFLTGRNDRKFRYECYIIPKYLIDSKL